VIVFFYQTTDVSVCVVVGRFVVTVNQYAGTSL